MTLNAGYFINKILRIINRPALRNCRIDKRSKVGTGSNLIAVDMGKYSYTGKNCSITNTEVGSFCSIASYCAIGGGEHNLNAVSTSPVFIDGRNVLKKNFGHSHADINGRVKIGNDVWIGEAVFIDAGITIGDGAVIGAHSVVTHNIPPYAIAVGAPVTIIRYRFDEETIKKMTAIKWWNWDDDELMKKGNLFSSPDDFLKSAFFEEN